jgi:hypothetical protein
MEETIVALSALWRRGSGGKLFDRGVYIRVKGKDPVHAGQGEQAADGTCGARNRQTPPRPEALEATDESAQAGTVDEVDLAQVEDDLGLSGLDAPCHFILECRSLAGIDPLLLNPDDENIIA